ncbi:MAG: ATP-binding cassette domain-containing protein [Actinomycetota bacterium]|nr:ATP-binding cassette domain-containing protein [Actinomycetota bacterium]
MSIETVAPQWWPRGGEPLAGARPDAGRASVGVHLSCRDLVVRASDGTALLDEITFDIRPGELVAIVGASGAGKSTLLGALAGSRAAAAGEVLIDGDAAHAISAARRREIGFVPQDDVIHRDLPLGRVLTYAARLRLPAGSTRADVRAAAARALAAVDLDDRADVRVSELSGGQRRRASIALELVTSPRACLLDEPTSGLDPVAAAGVVDELRRLADGGATVVFVTHAAADLARCDRIVAVAPGGRLAFFGTPVEAMEAWGVRDLEALHRRLTDGSVAPMTFAPRRPALAAGATPGAGARAPRRFVQWAALTARTLETVARNRLTLAIMVGSPAMVVAMFAVLFRPGAFDPADPSPTSAIMIGFWVAFGGFFFGLTYGLLQICPEVAMMRRERRGGVSPGLQLLAKLAALTPVLIAIDVAMLAVLRWFDRLPALDGATTGRLAITLALDAVAALALGLLASAAVSTPAQASLALPMLCFPAVLFSGAVLPVPVMAGAGRAISAAMSDRWAFEAVGRDLGLRELFASGSSPLGPALLDEYGSTWTVGIGTVWVVLVGFTALFSAAAWLVLVSRCRTGGSHTSAS